ncbi:MAG: TonB family protein [Bacteroidales bacterium]|nr:TonB family protein [Bacteroidales bacterium]
MGAFVTYLLKAGIFLLFFYLFNRLLLAQETFHRFNRIVWLLIIPFSLLLPFCIPGSFDPLAWFGLKEQAGQMLIVPEGMTATLVDNSDGSVVMARLVQWVLLVYFTGMLVCFLFFVISYIKLTAILWKNKGNGKGEVFGNLLDECKKLCRVRGRVRLLVHTQETAPFSWMRYVVVSEQDMIEDGKDILIHELSHVRQGHSWDLVLVDLLILFQWFNPAAWLLKQSIQQVHEFQADDAVLKAGINAKQYQLLLIKKAVGTRRYSMVNSFNHSKLKKRITMMWKKKSSKWAFAKCIYVLPLAFVALSAFAAPEISDRLSEISSVKDIKISLQQEIKPVTPPVAVPVPPPAVPVAEIVQEADQDTLVPLALLETKPLFANGQGEEAFTRWVFEHITYPEEAKNKGIQGTVIASFAINSEGEVVNVKIIRGVDPLLDKEAIRVLESSPKWERPGMIKGKKVGVHYNFPIKFGLRGKVNDTQLNQSADPKDIGLEPAVFANGQGEQAFQVWVMQHVTYPEEARKEKSAGTVFASFTVTENGSISDIKILRGVSPALDKEVIRVLATSPKWEKPAIANGQPVRVTYSLPVKFNPVEGEPQKNKELSTIVVNGQTIPPDNVLYVVDGKEFDKLPDIAPTDIESIEVLKDEKAVEKYGEKGRKGVIIIKLK